jgi:hypothetical protein
VVARRCRMIVIRPRQAADRGRDQTEDPSAKRPAPSRAHRAPCAEIQRTKCALLPASAHYEGAPAPKTSQKYLKFSDQPIWLSFSIG